VAGAGLFARALSLVRRGAVEGAPRPGPWHLPFSGGWLSAEAGQYWNWWQLGYNVEGLGRSAIVEACVSAYAQTVAMCPGDHWRMTQKGGRERVENSAAARLLRQPNAYQSISDFLLNLVRQLYTTGNAYALALRNDRYEADELHLMNSRLCRPVLSVDGEVFYRLAGNEVIARQLSGTTNQEFLVPARDVLHVRLHANQQMPWPLIGETPLTATYSDLATQSAILASQSQFYANQARPSAVLQTDLLLDKDQVADLRQRWDEQSKGLNAGNTPILTAGLKVQPWNVSARDAQLAEVLKLSEDHIALAFRIPLQILGISGTPAGSTEVLMQMWIATGLGFALNHIEEAFGLFFKLRGQPYEYIELSTDPLLRSAFKDRMDALTRGVQGGVYAPNEARELEGLDRVPFGDEPRVQQQVVPLSAAGKIAPAPGPPSPPPSPPAAQPVNDPHEARRALTHARTKVAAARRRF
jgi:HK97 family phage portal protein